MKILILDDDQKSYKKVIKKVKKSHDVVFEKDPSAASEVIQKTEFHLVLLNFDQDQVVMEALNLQLQKDHPEIKRLVVAKELGPQFFKQHQAGQTAAHGYLLKPFEQDVFSEVIEDCFADSDRDMVEQVNQTATDLELDNAGLSLEADKTMLAQGEEVSDKDEETEETEDDKSTLVVELEELNQDESEDKDKEEPVSDGPPEVSIQFGVDMSDIGGLELEGSEEAPSEGLAQAEEISAEGLADEEKTNADFEFDQDKTKGNIEAELSLDSESNEELSLATNEEEDQTGTEISLDEDEEATRVVNMSEYGQASETATLGHSSQKVASLGGVDPTQTDISLNHADSPLSSIAGHSMDPGLPQGKEYQEAKAYYERELVRLSSTLKFLREEREKLKRKNLEMEESSLQKRKALNEMTVKYEEGRIEYSLLLKKHREEQDSLRLQLGARQDQVNFLKEKADRMRRDYEELAQRKRVDNNQVRERELELENQLEMLKADSEAQLRSRDEKILELKRKIDTLEFNMESMTIQEQKNREDKYVLEEKLTKVMQTLRRSLESIEEQNIEDAAQSFIKKLKVQNS